MPAESATARAVHGEAVRWNLTDHLLAMVVDKLAVISWQLSGDRKIPRPTPLPRPGVPDAVVRHGHTGRSTHEVVTYLRRFAPQREEVTDG